MDSPTRSRRRWFGAIGAIVLVVANAVWARLAGGSEWTDPAIVLAPIAAALGAAAGFGVAAATDRRKRQR